MTATNKAFINAYSSAQTQGNVRPLRGEPGSHAFFGTTTHDSTTASSDGEAVVNAAATHDQPLASSSAVDTLTVETPRIDRPASAVRRPLSAVQAEEIFGFESPSLTTCTPVWPAMCQQLLAQSAERYDTVLRKLTASSTGVLIGIVGTAPRSGCTTTSICLAQRSSALGFPTALVDGNLSHGGLAAALEVDQFSSWGSLLHSSAPVSSATYTASNCRVDLLLTEPLPAPQLDSTARFRASLVAGVLRRKYERVVIDFGSVAHDNTSTIADLATAIGVDYLIATATPYTTSDQLHATSKKLHDHGLKLAGVIQAT